MAMGNGIPAGALSLRAELQGKKTRKIGAVTLGDRCATLRLGSDSLWAIIEGQKGAGLALRCAWAPGAPLELQSYEEGEVVLSSSLGTYRVRIGSPAEALLRVTTTLTPTTDVRVPWWPRDLYVLGPKGAPELAEGKVLAAQRGYNTAQLYAKWQAPGEATFFYLQDLTALNGYHKMTGTTPDGVVGGEWPELGYQPKPACEAPLAGGEEVTISDAFLRVDAHSVVDKQEEACIFLEHLAAIYPFLQKPDPAFHEWPEKAEATMRDVAESSVVTLKDGDYRYLRPYVDAEVPDSMVQITLVNMMSEYDHWKGEASPITEELRAGIYRFYDPEIGSVRRYLNTVGPEKNADEVDSWYLYHPLQGLAKLARAGDQEAKDIFLASLDYGIQVAHCFDYEWPIQFNVSSLEIITASREPGKAVGQTDAGGLYAYVMMDAFEFTGEERFLEEAKAAIRATLGLEFRLAYQTNLTSWGAAACLRLWKETEDRLFLDQASVFLASFFHNCAIWESKIGRVCEPTNFLGVTCLHDGPYLAPFECYESFCAFYECLTLAEDDLSNGARLLTSEFIRYAFDRGWWFYPSSLQVTSLAHSPRNGEIVRSLAIPLEDLYVNGDAAGQVGQEVYGAGAAAAYATRGFHRLDGDRLLFCEYPLRDMRSSAIGATFTVSGCPHTSCRASISPSEGIKITVDGKKAEPKGFSVGVGSKVRVSWK